MRNGKLTDDPQFWHRRAKEARASADAERNSEIRRKLRSLADNYEGIAHVAEKGARARKPRRRRSSPAPPK